MKPILIASASLLTAGAAFGFAKTVDRMTVSVARSPHAIYTTERAEPQPITRRAIQPVTAIPEAIPTVPEVPAALAQVEVEMVEPLAAEPTPPLALAEFPRAVPGDAPAMMLLPVIPPALDSAAPASRYEFPGIPLIGVYR